jgi:hypothetical protein
MKRKTKPVAPGPAINQSPEELDMAAIITPDDIAAAKADAAANMTPRGLALTQAERAEQEPDAAL